MSIAPDGIKTWTFYDSNLTGPCSDGLVDITETADPTVLEHTWRDLNGVPDATGLVERFAVCGGN